MAKKNKIDLQANFKAENADFKKKTDEVNKDMNTMRKELKLNATELKNNSDSLELLSQKQSILAKESEVSNNKIDLISKRLEKAKEAFGENSTEVQKLADSLIDAKNQFAAIQNDIKDTETKIFSLNSETKSLDEKFVGLEKELKLNATQLKNDSKNVELLTQKQKLLNQESEIADKKVDVLTKRLGEANVAFGNNSKEAKDLADKLNDAKIQFATIQNKIQDTDKELDSLSNSADDSGNELEKLNQQTEKAKGGFTVAKAAVAGFIANGLTALVGKCKEGIQWIAGLAGETREFRQDMNTLTTAFDAANFSSETAQKTWKDLYGIFGEDDRAVEAANNISRMAENEEDLNEWVRITTGIWGTYQDALPVESLAEAAGETAKTAQVTGALADALNWNSEAAKMFSQYMSEDVTTAEDAFNVALSKCSNEQERQQLITQTLTTLYGNAADKYNETAGNIIEANKATADLTTAQAELGSVTEPVINSVNLGFAGLLTEFTNLLDLDTEGISNGISQAFGDFQNNILPKITDGLKWIDDNSDSIIVGVEMLGAAFIAWKVASVIAGVTSALQGMSIAQMLTTAKQWLLNTAMSANPIGFIITLIAGLVAAFVVLWNKSDKFRNFWIGLWEKIKSAVSNVVDWFKGIPESIGALFDKIKAKIKVPKISVSYSTDGTLGKVAEAIGLPGFPKLNVTWNKDGHFFTGKTLEVRGYAEAGDSEYALPLNKKTLDPLAAGIVNHMDAQTDMSDVISHIDALYNEVRTGNITIKDKFIDAVANRLAIKLDSRELGRVVRSY